MGDVWVAHAADGTRVALKRLHPHLARDAKLLAQFEREARIGASLEHENLVQVLDFGRDAVGPFLALEFVDGLAASALLQAWMERSTVLPLTVALAIARDAAAALDHAHAAPDAQGRARSIIHRDISPDNVLVRRDGVAKLADFGISKVLGATDLTESGVVKGKHGFLAPELYDGHAPDVRSDLFAFGATVFTLLCGVRPFHGESSAELMRAVLSADAASLATLRPDAPAAVVSWVQRALLRDVSSRPTGVRPLLEALESSLASSPEYRAEVASTVTWALESRALSDGYAPALGASVLTRVEGNGAGKKSRQRKVLGALGGAAVVGALAAFGWFFLRAPPVSTMSVSAASPALPPALQRALPEETPVPENVPSVGKVAPARRPATLWIKVTPWAQVFLDGDSLGVTPVSAVKVSPGVHSVLVVNPETRIRKQARVSIRVGEQRVLKLTLP